MHVIDTGQGNCILVECPGGGLVLDDCGSLKASLPPLKVERYINRIIRQYTDVYPILPRPLAVIASHPDRDHFDLIASSRYRIDPAFVSRVMIAQTLDAYPPDFQDWANATEAVETFPPNAHGPLRAVKCGLARVELLTVNASRRPGQKPPVSRNNADSAVIAIRYNQFLAVLPGDAEGPTEDQVLRNYPELRPTLLVASHHGADTAGSNSRAWARALRPGIVIFSAAFDNSFGHPRASAVENYLEQPGLLPVRAHHIEFYEDRTGPVPRTVDKAIYTTGYGGTIVVVADGKGGMGLDCANISAGGC